MEYIVITGHVICLPEVRSGCTEFQLLTEDHTLTVIRTDLHWQKRDILFLNIGQQLCITGRTEKDSPCTVYAEHITVLTDPREEGRRETT